MRTEEIVIRRHAGPLERYDPGAFANAIGKTMKLRTALGTLRAGARLVEAEVAEDGSYVDLVLEVPGKIATLLASGFLG